MRTSFTTRRHPRESGDPAFSELQLSMPCNWRNRSWFPASAGMTDEEKNAAMSAKKDMITHG